MLLELKGTGSAEEIPKASLRHCLCCLYQSYPSSVPRALRSCSSSLKRSASSARLQKTSRDGRAHVPPPVSGWNTMHASRSVTTLRYVHKGRERRCHVKGPLTGQRYVYGHRTYTHAFIHTLRALESTDRQGLPSVRVRALQTRQLYTMKLRAEEGPSPWRM